MIKLATNNSLWGGFAGACSFPDGHEPLFAEMAFPAGCPMANPEPWAMLICDYQTDGGEPDADRDIIALTINLISEEGYPATYERRFPANMFTRENIVEWAEKALDNAMTHKGLVLNGFAFTAH